MPRLTADQWAAIRIEWEGERKAWGLDAKSEEDIIITNPRRIEP
jgi:hypothetical protein